MACPCGIEVPQPWTTRGDLWSPASLIVGLVLLLFGVLILVWDVEPAAAFVVFGIVGASVVGGWTMQTWRRHRGWCLVRRATWFGIASPGAAIRLILSM